MSVDEREDDMRDMGEKAVVVLVIIAITTRLVHSKTRGLAE
jgi:hypothetical protein